MTNTEGHVTRARSHLQQHVAFGGVPVVNHGQGSYPHFAKRVDGCRFWDIDNREYLDWFGGGGPCMLGHRHPAVQQAVREQLEAGPHLSIPAGLEVEVAERICSLVPGVEQVQLVKNGTDATSAAVRLARSATGRDHILTNGYHGFQDWSMATSPNPSGIPASIAALSHQYAFNDLDRATALMQQHGDDVAAIFVSPLQEEAPAPGFLQGLRDLCDRHGAMLVFDEIVTGFRVARGGMQEREGVLADVVCLGKALGNGFPIAATAGPRRSMKYFRNFRYGMTAQREALSLAAANACLQVFASQDIPAHLERIGDRLRTGFEAAAREHDLDWTISGMSHWPHLVFQPAGRLTAEGVRALFFETVQRLGVYISSPRIWPCLAHTDADVDRTLEVVGEAMKRTREAMQNGLARYVDRPVYPFLDRECNSEPNLTDWRLVAEPVPFDCADMPNCLMILSGSSQGPDVQAKTRDSCIELQVRAQHDDPEANGAATTAATLTPAIEGDCRISADYQFVDWHPHNATIEIVLAINDANGSGHRSVSHSLSLAGTNWLHTTGSDGRQRFPCVADVDAATLIMERRAGVWSATFRCDCDEVTLPIASGRHEAPVRITFRLRSTGKVGHVRLNLRNLLVEPLVK